ncbi:glycerol-3-phosphate dehydrogenase [Azospirillum sp.]|uniref:glycerol-3-phosphate dehydrogenase n=1 Tax=Azospirillum sp. TaxID=34012 RepID=UPI002D5F9778|nr:glycerol-3-phosphate dehydrogenase [Azospirillum sp.]HYD67764.1 glycerol-3-phosphate dehydrogenase [Azospirillum sp.]
MTSETYDLLVVGGGITGAGIARDASGRGLKVLLVEQDDLASATSSASSKLVHGGLRHLERGEIRLAREALAERDVLLRTAPHIVRPMRFVAPHDGMTRPAWVIRTGLFLYDRLDRAGALPGTESLDLERDPRGRGLKPALRQAFAYSGAWVDDARLVVLNAVDAQARGAEIRTRTHALSARREEGLWTVRLLDRRGGGESAVRARILVNAAGPWATRVLGETLGRPVRERPRFAKGSHLVIPRLYDGDHAFILQTADRRTVYTIPYEGDFTLVGTTDVPFDGDPGDVRITPEEVIYLRDAVNRYFTHAVRPTEVVHTFAGLRPLPAGAPDDPTLTGDCRFDVDAGTDAPPLISVHGGTLTNHRRVAEAALDRLRPFIYALQAPWTHGAVLPGGDLPDGNPGAFTAAFHQAHPWLSPTVARRWCRLYGTRAAEIVEGAARWADLGEDFGNGLTAAELRFLAEREFAATAEDVLWRRTKLGLKLPAESARRVAAWFGEAPPAAPSVRAAG